MKKVLITGGAGFIAHHLIGHILKNTDWEIVSLDRLDFNVNEFLDLNLKDGLATINEFIALSIFLGSKKYLEKNTVILLGGGGRKNIDLKNRIIAKFKNKVITTDQLGLNGDLIESYFKRINNIKDSSKYLPGHGGFFDRFDSFISSIIFLTLYSYIFL